MDYILYILPLGLVRLRTFRLAHGLVRPNMSAGVHACAGRMCRSEMSKENSKIGNGTREVNDVMHRERARRIWGI